MGVFLEFLTAPAAAIITGAAYFLLGEIVGQPL